MDFCGPPGPMDTDTSVPGPPGGQEIGMKAHASHVSFKGVRATVFELLLSEGLGNGFLR
jgi:hypothetical protein